MTPNEPSTQTVMPPIIDSPNQTQTEVLTEKAAVIAGAVAGCLAPLTTVAVTAFNRNSNMVFSDIPWVLMLVFAVIGAVVVFFLAERNRRHVFTYAIAAPFLVLAIIRTHDAEAARTEVEAQGKVIQTGEETNNVLNSLANDLRKQAQEQKEAAEKATLDTPGESLSYPPADEATINFENPSI